MQQQLTNAEYHARPELSASQCKVLLENPHKFYLGLGTEANEAMRFGSIVHKLILEPEDFDREYAVSPKFDGRTTKGKADKAAFEAQNQTNEIITIESYQLAEKCAESVLNSRANKLLKNGIAEAAVFGQLNGVDCRCKPDYYVPSKQLIVDIKTCADSSPEGFTRMNANFKYYLQAAFYMDVMASAGKPIKQFVFVCVNKSSSPYMVGLYQLSQTAIEIGRAQYQEAIRVLNSIKDFNEPIYKDKAGHFIQTIDLPIWVINQVNQQAEMNYAS